MKPGRDFRDVQADYDADVRHRRIIKLMNVRGELERIESRNQTVLVVSVAILIVAAVLSIMF
jgi:hypothetical protein